MALTSQQLNTLKTAINANPVWAAYPMNGDGYFDLARALNAEAAPAFFVWATNVDVQSIRAKITWANLTPIDVPDGTQAWANRALQCQGKQFAIQLLVPMTGTFNASDVNTRAGLQDALQAIRSGASGVSQGAGWAAVQGALSRRATYGEKILADTTNGDGGTKPLAATMSFEGSLSPEDVEAARNN